MGFVLKFHEPKIIPRTCDENIFYNIYETEGGEAEGAIFSNVRIDPFKHLVSKTRAQKSGYPIVQGSAKSQLFWTPVQLGFFKFITHLQKKK